MSMHLIGWQNTWEQAPGVPATLPRPDGGGNPWPCTCVHGPKKLIPSRHELQLRRPPQFSARLDPMPCRNNNGHVTLSKNCTCARTTLMVMSPHRYTSHFSLRHLPFNLNREKKQLSAQISSLLLNQHSACKHTQRPLDTGNN